MFGTYRFNNVNKDYEHVKLTAPSGVEARGYSARACDLCRAKKLKCDGSKDGCERCRAAMLGCTYTKNSSNVGRPHRRSTTWTSWPPSSSRSPESRRLSQPEAPRNSQVQDSIQGAGGSHGKVARETSGVSEEVLLDTTEPSITVPDFSWDPMESSFDPLPSFFAGDGSNEMISGHTEALSMDPSPIFGTWSNSSSSSEPRPQENAASFRPQTPKQPIAAPVWPGAVGTSGNSDGQRLAAGCQCLRTMAQILEDKDARWLEKGVDTLLMGVGIGIQAYQETLACGNCNMCTENAMLLALVAQCLAAAATNVAEKLCSGDRNQPSGTLEDGFGGPILLGCYRLEIPMVRALFVGNVAQQHLADLRTLLGNIKDRMGQKWGSVEMIAEAEDEVVKSHCEIHQLLESRKIV